MISTKNEVTGIKVFRAEGATTRSLYYQRTGRGLKELIDSPRGELHYFLKSSPQFISEIREKKVLDLGCGNGNFILDLKKLSSSVQATGVDLCLSPAQKINPAFQAGDAFALPFAAQTFDVLISTWSVFTYEPVNRLGVILNEAHRVLQPNGTMLMGPFLEFEQMAQFFRCAHRLGLMTMVDPKSNFFWCKKTRS
jgi:ubiquinone/menaquinone biosynthesis C-methylase UbiE